MESDTGPRYSLGRVDIGAAKDFPGEYPVPSNDFWNPLDYSTSSNFLRCFSHDEIKHMDLDASLSEGGKLELLMKLLGDKLSLENNAAFPSTAFDVNYQVWDSILLGISTIQSRQGKFEAAEETLRDLVDKRKDPANLTHVQTLSSVLLRNGKFIEAEEREIPVQAWLDKCLGPDSPQALGARRILTEAVWKQGRKTNAQELITDMQKIIDGMGSGKFAVYQEQHQKLMNTMVEELEKWSASERRTG